MSKSADSETKTTESVGKSTAEVEKVLLDVLANTPEGAALAELVARSGHSDRAVRAALKELCAPDIGLVAVEPCPDDRRLKLYRLRVAPADSPAAAESVANQGAEGGDPAMPEQIPTGEGQDNSPVKKADKKGGNKSDGKQLSATRKTTWKDRADQHRAKLDCRYRIVAHWLRNSVPASARSEGVVTGRQLFAIGHRPEALLARGCIQELPNLDAADAASAVDAAPVPTESNTEGGSGEQ